MRALKKDYRKADLQPAERAILDFAVKLTRAPHATAAGDLDTLRRHGLGDEAILEVVHITGFFNYINRVADALGVDPEPEWETGPDTRDPGSDLRLPSEK